MTDAPVDLDDAQDVILESMSADDRQQPHQYRAACRMLDALIAELRAARAPVEPGVELMSCCGGSDEHPPEHTQDCECDCGHELSEHGGHIGSGFECDACSCSRFLPGVSRAAPPADEVAGLLDALRTLGEYATGFDAQVAGETMPVGAQAAYDRIENHLKGKR